MSTKLLTRSELSAIFLLFLYVIYMYFQQKTNSDQIFANNGDRLSAVSPAVSSSKFTRGSKPEAVQNVDRVTRIGLLT